MIRLRKEKHNFPAETEKLRKIKKRNRSFLHKFIPSDQRRPFKSWANCKSRIFPFVWSLCKRHSERHMRPAERKISQCHKVCWKVSSELNCAHRNLPNIFGLFKLLGCFQPSSMGCFKHKLSINTSFPKRQWLASYKGSSGRRRRKDLRNIFYFWFSAQKDKRGEGRKRYRYFSLPPLKSTLN